MRKGQKLSLIGVFVLLAVLAASWAELSKLDVTRLPTRATWQLPERVVASLGIAKGDRVADLGAGDGYFTFLLAEAVGPEGWVWAVEVDEDKVLRLERAVVASDHANIEVVHGGFDDPRLPDGGVGLVFLCNTYHHIESRELYFARLRTDLKKGGRVATIDMRDDLGGIARLFAHRDHWTSVRELNAEMAEAGYRHQKNFDYLPVQSFEIFAALP